MGHYDELDREIDQEMGWADQLKKDDPRRKRALSAGTLILHLLRKFRLPRPLASALKSIARTLRNILLFPLVSPLSYSKSYNLEGDMMVVKRSWPWRAVDGLLTRLVLTPLIVGIFLIAIVYCSTHPQRVQAYATPESVGLYFKRIRLVTLDGQGLTSWYIPPITAGEMSFNPEASLAQKWPAAVLCHGLGAAHDQYLGLAQELHDAGFAVLLVDMRGQGESDPAAITYGLRERLDVLAGVKYLRELPNIDSGKVCVVGHDIAALASLQAATLDSAIPAVVADGMWPRFEDRARLIFAHAGQSVPFPIGWLAPLYSITFEIAVRDRLNQLDPEAIVRNIHTQPVLFIARQGPHYAPVTEVLSLAASVGSHHEVLVANEAISPREIQQRIKNFLVLSTHWKAPKARGTETIQKLLDQRVK